MIALIGYYWYGLLLAFAIGLVTAWWTWSRLPAPMPVEIDPDDALIDWHDGPPPPHGLADIEAAPADEAEGTEVVADEADMPDEPEHEGDVVEEQEADETNESPVAGPQDALGQAIAAASAPVMPVEEPEPLVLTPPDVPEIEDEAEVAAAPSNAPDDLMMIKGVGPQIADLLRSLGIQRFEEIAGWMPEDIERIDGQLGIFKGRILRDEWIGQARLLAKGDMETFAQRYGHLS